ncbi:MAG: hypothetical protein KA109_16190 [Saprospiraceae bacterium]|nr:hypothetical protein [Saprospiraceae bacterium]MBK7436995.1 hypothetical protein [Saprospiraceae bacterium]MBK7606705.1 hypothetical protein [Saprospiraceae bacterium]MBK8283001.1 hypothetical protein [Saprospiraceae bacterium]MBK8512962.1 hypothetical protein [Saprospiraceae bacterium]
MIFVQIPEKEEPYCLKELRKVPDTKYIDLKDHCKDEVEGKLSHYQFHLCAYCQKSIKDVKTIEHYIPKSPKPSPELEWNNMFAVCTGRWYLDRDTKIDYCANKRGSRPLKLNPKDKNHIDSLYYEECMLHSSDADIDLEINDLTILNLNFSEILTARLNAFIGIEKIYKKLALQRKLSQSETLMRAIETVKKLNPEYSGFLLYRYERKLKNVN